MKIKLFILVCLLALGSLNAQLDSLKIASLKKYTQTSVGLYSGAFIGNVSEFINYGGGLDLSISYTKKKHLYGFNVNYFLSKKEKDFTIPNDYKPTADPALFMLGFVYGQTFGNPHKSHFQGTAGINYGWLLFNKKEETVGGYHGVMPQIEFSRSIRIGKPRFSLIQNTELNKPRRIAPTLTNRFINFYLGYKQLLLNNEEGHGGQILFGIRYKSNSYSFKDNSITL